MSTRVAISGSGVHVPTGVVTNAELCHAFNAWVDAENSRREGTGAEPLARSSSAFIERASGIRERRFFAVEGTLDPERMRPDIPDRPDDQLSVQAEFGLLAARAALEDAGRSSEDVDLVVVGASALQRPYPSVGIEIQAALGARGFAYDVSVGCSSAGFAVELAMQSIASGMARCAVVCSPELPSAYANYRERSSHFILGDAAVALVLEPVSALRKPAFEILSSKCATRYSTNVRNNGGFLNRGDPGRRDDDDKLFYQNGRNVYKDITRLVPTFVSAQLASMGLGPREVARYWLHQANAQMLHTIHERLTGDRWDPTRVPLPLETFGNTAAAGALLAFAQASADLEAGDYGVLCAFGAGYSVSSQILRKI